MTTPIDGVSIETTIPPSVSRVNARLGPQIPQPQPNRSSDTNRPNLKILHIIEWEGTNIKLTGRDNEGKVTAFTEQDWKLIQVDYIKTLVSMKKLNPNLKADQLIQTHVNFEKQEICYLDASRKTSLIDVQTADKTAKLDESFNALKETLKRATPSVIEYETGKTPEDKGIFNDKKDDVQHTIFNLKSGASLKSTDLHYYLHYITQNHKKIKNPPFEFAFHPPLSFDGKLKLAEIVDAMQLEKKQKEKTRLFLTIEMEDKTYVPIEINFQNKKISYYTPINEQESKIKPLLDKLQETFKGQNQASTEWPIEKAAAPQMSSNPIESGVQALLVAENIINGDSFVNAVQKTNALTDIKGKRQSMAVFLEGFNEPPADPNQPPVQKKFWDRFKFWNKKPSEPQAPTDPNAPLQKKFWDRFKFWNRKPSEPQAPIDPNQTPEQKKFWDRFKFWNRKTA